MSRLRVYLTTAIAWSFTVLAYGYWYASSMTAYLQVHPSGDLYANNFGFQVLTFAFVRGLALLFVLALVLFMEKCIMEFIHRPTAKMRG